ncbi:GMP reductase 2 [Perkinsus olseni]|uniref:GMP reductase n=1 Tax=Perkinsus olseni TaxID=32597 RepID=A0A7J6Q2W8_PEROL|nr:GMP reductase 2 [Perkinsus olseni]
MHSPLAWTGVPILAANMDTVGTFAMAEVLSKFKCLVAVHKHYSLEQWRTWCSRVGRDVLDNVAVSTGILKDDLIKLKSVMDISKANFICLDVANGYAEAFVEVVKTLRRDYPDKVIMAGNVVTGEMCEELLLSGADIVKVGIGPGSVCTTRKMTGVGYPQLSAVIECADAAHGIGGMIISDGGCTCSGDVCKAFGGGADFVMLGGMLAGHDESGGQLVHDLKSERWYKEFYGMSSDTAMNKYAGGVANYRASEGKSVKVPYRGPVGHTVQDVLGGLRSCCTYVGARALKELSKRTTFVRVTQQLNPVFDHAPAAPQAPKAPPQPTVAAAKEARETESDGPPSPKRSRADSSGSPRHGHRHDSTSPRHRH